MEYYGDLSPQRSFRPNPVKDAYASPTIGVSSQCSIIQKTVPRKTALEIQDGACQLGRKPQGVAKAMSETEMSVEKHVFEADVARLLHLMVHSVYSDKNVFLRELISNAADACAEDSAFFDVMEQRLEELTR